MTTSILPPMTALEAAAAELAQRANDAGNAAASNLFNKAIYHLQAGIAERIRATVGGLLIPSTTGGEVYKVSTVHGCSCRGYVNHGHCYHAKMVEIAEYAAQYYTMPALATPDPWEQARARVEIEELFA